MATDVVTVRKTPRASDIAYDRICEMIVDLRLEPASMVDEQSIAQSVGLGRMPVREALARLASDNLLRVLPRRGMMIAPIGLDTVLEIFEAREPIECGNAYLAAQHISAAELLELRQLVAAADAARTDARFQSYLEADGAVHRLLARAAHNSFLQDATLRILKHNLRLWNFYFAGHPAGAGILMTHEPVLRALERRDPDAARQAMRDHILTSRDHMRQIFYG